MSTERPPRAFADLGMDINEQLLTLRNMLLDRLGSDKEVAAWMQRHNDEFLGGELPEVVLKVDPDKVAVAAFHARKIRAE